MNIVNCNDKITADNAIINTLSDDSFNIIFTTGASEVIIRLNHDVFNHSVPFNYDIRLETLNNITVYLNNTQMMHSNNAYYLYNISLPYFVLRIDVTKYAAYIKNLRVFKLTMNLVYDTTFNAYNKLFNYLLYAPGPNIPIIRYHSKENHTLNNIIMKNYTMYHNNAYTYFVNKSIANYWTYNKIHHITDKIVYLRAYVLQKDMLLLTHNWEATILLDRLDHIGEKIAKLYNVSYMIMNPNDIYILSDFTIINNKLDTYLSILDTKLPYDKYNNKIIYMYDSKQRWPLSNICEVLDVMKYYGIILCDTSNIELCDCINIIYHSKRNIILSCYKLVSICEMLNMNTTHMIYINLDDQEHEQADTDNIVIHNIDLITDQYIDINAFHTIIRTISLC